MFECLNHTTRLLYFVHLRLAKPSTQESFNLLRCGIIDESTEESFDTFHRQIIDESATVRKKLQSWKNQKITHLR